MHVEINEIGPGGLAAFSNIPMQVMVKELLQVHLLQDGMGGMILQTEKVSAPYLKDYEADADERPADWPQKFDVHNWGFFMAMAKGEPVGAAAVAFDTPGIFMLEGRRDLAVLWDIRSLPAWRGVGILLFRHAAAWARARGRRQLKVETQNINVPACRFYRRMGCRLGGINQFVYSATPAVAHEIMLSWYLDLDQDQ